MSQRARRSKTLWIAVALLGVSAGGCQFSDCLKDVGCKDSAQVPIEPCAGSVSATPLEDFFAGPPSPGATVTVVGPTRQTSTICTQVDCGGGSCCNSCGASIVLSNKTEPTGNEADTLTLQGRIGDANVGCGGDESQVCCSMPTDGQQLRVTGVVVETINDSNGPRFALEVSAICSN